MVFTFLRAPRKLSTRNCKKYKSTRKYVRCIFELYISMCIKFKDSSSELTKKESRFLYYIQAIISGICRN